MEQIGRSIRHRIRAASVRLSQEATGTGLSVPSPVKGR